MARYSASINRSQGRQGWSVTFRHPARKDVRGKAVRVRQGLGTTDSGEAENLKAQLDILIGDEQFWEPLARPRAEQRFDKRVVDIFYHALAPELFDARRCRDEYIPLPNEADDSYTRVLLLGTTGAGKTTLVRQLIGSDPERERFPSTSTAKTTIHDAEIVLADGLYRVVVTFAPYDEVREHLSDCVSAAVLCAHRCGEDAEISRRLLNHVNQRFRFSYILGHGPCHEVEDDEDSLDIEDQASFQDGSINLTRTNDVLSGAIKSARTLDTEFSSSLRAQLEPGNETDERVVDELFEEELDSMLREDERFDEIVDALMEEIEARFDHIDKGITQRTRQKWPISWCWECEDRQSFIETVSRFASNRADRFGTLLTPLVNGMRIAGKFVPTWATDSQIPRLVLLDGEGLGHVPTPSSAISSSLKERINLSDVILLVDNAAQPMQAASVAAMRELVSSGNSGKLVLVFTHFDEVKGDNLPNFKSRTQHVLASAENVLAAFGEELGPFAERVLRQRIEKWSYFLGNIDKILLPGTTAMKKTITQLQDLIGRMHNRPDDPEPSTSTPVYDKLRFVLAFRDAAERFQGAWQSRLGLKIKAGVPKEHWTRVKALARRLSNPIFEDEYDTLKPVADLRKELQDRMYILLQSPKRWKGAEPSDDEKQVIFDKLADDLSRRIQSLAGRRIREQRFGEWGRAFDQHGRGSTYIRANIISGEIYEEAAPVPDSAPSLDKNEFLREVMAEVESSMQEFSAILE